MQWRQPRFRPPRPPPALPLRDSRPPRPPAQHLAQPILRNRGPRPRPRPRPPRTRPGRAHCLRGWCSPRRLRRACPVSGLTPPGSATSLPREVVFRSACVKSLAVHSLCLPNPTPGCCLSPRCRFWPYLCRGTPSAGPTSRALSSSVLSPDPRTSAVLSSHACSAGVLMASLLLTPSAAGLSPRCRWHSGEST